MPAFPASSNAEPDSASVGSGDLYFDGGERSCGELLIKLKFLINDLDPGQVLHLHTDNEGFVMDASAWCGLTGNELLQAAPPDYLIRKAASA